MYFILCWGHFKSINNPEDPFFLPDDDILYVNERFLNSEIQLMFDELNDTIIMKKIMKAIRPLKMVVAVVQISFLNEFFIHGNGELLRVSLYKYQRLTMEALDMASLKFWWNSAKWFTLVRNKNIRCQLFGLVITVAMATRVHFRPVFNKNVFRKFQNPAISKVQIP